MDVKAFFLYPYAMPIKDWNEDDRPREKLIANGPEACSVAELIAILITNGTPERSAVQLGRDIMTLANNDLINFTRLTTREIESIKGIATAKSSIIRAAQELGKRISASSFGQTVKLLNSKSIYELMRDLRTLTHEEFWALYTQNSGILVRKTKISQGSGGCTKPDFKLILANAFEVNATRIILCHNHPGATCYPSQGDINRTNNLAKICNQLEDLTVIEHVIIAGDSYYSFCDEGLIG